MLATGNARYDKYDQLILDACKKYGFPDPLVIKAQMHLESFYEVFAISKDTPCAGIRPKDWSIEEGRSYGLMQITPACHPPGYKAFGMLLANGHPNLEKDQASALWAGSVFNPANNVPIAVANMKCELDIVKRKFAGCTPVEHLKMALSYYNSGRDSVAGCGQYNARGRAYVEKIQRIYGELAVIIGTSNRL